MSVNNKINPVDIYITQALSKGELLTPREELKATRKIEIARRKYHSSLICSDRVILKVTHLLTQIIDGKLRLDRTLSVAVADVKQKTYLRKFLPLHNNTLKKIIERNRLDFRKVSSKSISFAEKRNLIKRMKQRRRHAFILISELRFRIAYITPIFNSLIKAETEMSMLRNAIRNLKSAISNNPLNVDLKLFEQLRQNRNKLKLLKRKVNDSPKELKKYIAKVQKNRFEYEEIKRNFSVSNLRLVISIAKMYRHRGIGFLDLIQEGNAGLIKAVDRFERKRKCKFSTYATWWIRQSIVRAIANNGRTIRVPVRVLETISRVGRVANNLVGKLGTAPSVYELAAACNMSGADIAALLNVNQRTISLNLPVDESDRKSLSDIIEDTKQLTPVERLSRESLKLKIDEVLQSLTAREREVIKLRYGLVDGSVYTLEEVGKMFSVTRERIRQIEATAFKKLQHPVRSRALSFFLN
ncbi:MAG: sigma-70 family RNA polymerase sigma factor [Planctomycetaceae bacterium]|jgi:RNA polymerase primary sigma factor|nr:sigma-70 family RNA polymerase sigma factor [Planctomycetaceae bacterium]